MTTIDIGQVWTGTPVPLTQAHDHIAIYYNWLPSIPYVHPHFPISRTSLFLVDFEGTSARDIFIHFLPWDQVRHKYAQMTRNWINVSWRKAMEPRDSWRTNTFFPAETNRGNENRRNGGWTNSCSTANSTIWKRSEIVLYYLTWPQIIQQQRNLVDGFNPTERYRSSRTIIPNIQLNISIF